MAYQTIAYKRMRPHAMAKRMALARRLDLARSMPPNSPSTGMGAWTAFGSHRRLGGPLIGHGEDPPGGWKPMKIVQLFREALRHQQEDSA